MLNLTPRVPLTLADEIRLLGLRQFIRVARWLRRMEAPLALIRRYYWLPPLAWLIGILIGLVVSVAI